MKNQLIQKITLLPITISILVIIIWISGCEDFIRQTGLKTGEAVEIGYTTVKVEATITDLSSLVHEQFGFCCSKQTNPTLSDLFVDLGTQPVIGTYTGEFSGLEPNTTYYYCAFIKEGDDYIFDKPYTFTTLTAPMPVLTINNALSVTYNSAVVTGNIVSGNGDSITVNGFCYGVQQNPSLTDSVILNKLLVRTFTDTLTKLQSSTTYYVRMFGTNKYGTGYSEQISFTTVTFQRPTIITDSVFNVLDNEARCAGTLTSIGQGNVTEMGFCYGTNPTPDISDSKITIEPVTGYFTCLASGLTPLSQYYFRAYAINDGGVSYGEVKNITMKAPSTLPAIGMYTPQMVNYARLMITGQVYDNGGGISEHGLCWSETEYYPTITGNHMVADSVKNNIYYVNNVPTDNFQFYMNLYFLKPNTSYKFRTYAKNSAGVAYSPTTSFMTPADGLPEITTDSCTRILASSAHIKCSEVPYITRVPGVTYGICWSTQPNPTISDNSALAAVYSVKNFEAIMSNLQSEITYYVKGWIANNSDIKYGNELSFTTLSASDVVKDFDGNEYTMVTIGTQVWMQQDLKTTHYANGEAINGVMSYNGNEEQDKIYGLLYNSPGATHQVYTVGTQGACPDGWHLPSVTEWNVMIDYLGGNGVAATHLKEKGAIHWTYQNDGTNTSGFSALGSGVIRNQQILLYRNTNAYFWTSTPSGISNNAFGITSGFGSLSFGSIDSDGTTFHSIRCIKN